MIFDGGGLGGINSRETSFGRSLAEGKGLHDATAGPGREEEQALEQAVMDAKETFRLLTLQTLKYSTLWVLVKVKSSRDTPTVVVALSL